MTETSDRARSGSTATRERSRSRLRVIATAALATTDPRYRDELIAFTGRMERIGVTGIHAVRNRGLVGLTVDIAQRAAVLADPFVRALEEATPLEPLVDPSFVYPYGHWQYGTGDTSAPLLWLQGIDGSGQILAFIDTGIDGTHPAFEGRVVAEACFSTQDETLGLTSLCADGVLEAFGPGSAAHGCTTVQCDHGTRVAGAAAGADPGAPEAHPGMAPGASIIAINAATLVTDPTSCAPKPAPCVKFFPDNVIAALEYALELHAAQPVAALNLSLGGGRHTVPCGPDPWYYPSIQALVANGVAVIAAAGNDGYTDAISKPACFPSVIAVAGAEAASWEVVSASNSSTLVDYWAPWSSRVPIATPQAWGLTGGTSIAAPHVTGAWALLRQFAPTADEAQLRAWLAAGPPLTDSRNGVTHPFIDVALGVAAAQRETLIPAEQEHLGESAAVGDFNGDNLDDIAIGVPGANVDGAVAAGEVIVLYGSPNGPSIVQVWSQQSPGISDTAELGDGFGSALVAADFNTDLHWDLAIGVWQEDFGPVPDVGAVHVLYGGPAGLDAANSQRLVPPLENEGGIFSSHSEFGRSLATLGSTDLVIGAPGSTVDGLTAAGSVYVLRGSDSGLTNVGAQLWTQSSPGVEEVAEAGDRFGSSLAVGRHTSTGTETLVIGAEGEDIGGSPDAGAIVLLRGWTGIAGPFALPGNVWHQSMGYFGASEPGDRFGASLAAGDFDGDGHVDLAVGVPGESFGSAWVGTGEALLFYGSDIGWVDVSDHETLRQGAFGVQDSLGPGDGFGSSLAVGDFDWNGSDDLIVGVPAEDGPFPDVGMLHVVYGDADRNYSHWVWYPGFAGLEGAPVAGGRFGACSASGDFDGDIYPDLVVGVPGDLVWGTSEAGSVMFLAGGPAGLTPSVPAFHK